MLCSSKCHRLPKLVLKSYTYWNATRIYDNIDASWERCLRNTRFFKSSSQTSRWYSCDLDIDILYYKLFLVRLFGIIIWRILSHQISSTIVFVRSIIAIQRKLIINITGDAKVLRKRVDVWRGCGSWCKSRADQ